MLRYWARVDIGSNVPTPTRARRAINEPRIWIMAAAVLISGCGAANRANEIPAPAWTETRAQQHASTSARRDGSERTYRVFVAAESDDVVTVLDGPPWRRVRTISVPAGPHNVEASPDGRWVAASSPPAGAVTIISTDTARVRARRRVLGAHDVAFTRNGRGLWVTGEQTGRLVRIRVPDGRVQRSIALGAHPHDLAVVAGRLWLTIDRSATVLRRLASNGRPVASIAAGGRPHDIGLSPSGRVWLSNWNSGVLTVVSARSGRVVARVRAGAEPHHFAFTRERVWASDNAAGSVALIDESSRRIQRRTRVGPSPHHIAAVGASVLVAVHDRGAVVALSSTGRLRQAIAVGAGPHGIAAVSRTQSRARPRGSRGRVAPAVERSS